MITCPFNIFIYSLNFNFSLKDFNYQYTKKPKYAKILANLPPSPTNATFETRFETKQFRPRQKRGLVFCTFSFFSLTDKYI